MSYTHDKDGRCTSVTISQEEKGKVLTFTNTYAYNKAGDIIESVDNAGNVTRYEYDDNGNQTAVVDSKERRFTYDYDDQGNLIKTTYPDGTFETFAYDANGNNTKATDRSGLTVNMTYDKLDRMIEKKYADGTKESYTYDAVGRVEKVINALGKTMEYTYDETGNLTSFKDYAGTVTDYVYDGMDRMIKKTIGKDATEYAYSDTGLLLKVTDQSGTIQYAYDKYDRLVKQTDAKGVTLTYTYDEAGRLHTFDNGFGKTTYEYDLMDRVTRVIDRNGKATVYEYDGLGNRSAVRYPNGNEVTYTYDACQRLKEEWVTNANGITLARYTYGLGKAGERTSITEINSSGIETETIYKYDKLNRLVKETIERDKNKLINEYTYDKVSNRISKETTVKGELSALVDTASEEIKVTEGKTTYTYNALNQLVTETSPEGAIVYTYDSNDNLIKQTGDKTVDYSYDKENHLLRATVQKGNSVIIESYTYDYAGNRTSKTVNEQDTTYYVNDTSLSLTQVVAETDKDGKEKSYYTRSDELVSMEKGNEVWYYLYDGHGRVRTLTERPYKGESKDIKLKSYN